MPLLKLWNALWGRPARGQAAREEATAPPAIAQAGANAEPPGASRKSSHTSRSIASSPSNATSSSGSTTEPNPGKPQRRVKPSGMGFQLFGGNPHAALCKLVAPTRARSVLEVGVGDGTRAIAVVQTLAKQGIAVRYAGIDQFELSGGAVTLKDFHRTLRAAGIRPQLFPVPVDRGLIQFLHTIGRADLILLADHPNLVEDPLLGQLLNRVSHAETTVLRFQNDTWSPMVRHPGRSHSGQLRRAA